TEPGWTLKRHWNGVLDPQPLTTFEPYVISQLKSHLISTYADIHQKAPNAEIVVVGYPHLFPANPTDCQVGFGVSFSAADQKWMNQMGDKLNDSIKGAVDAVKSTGVLIHFVNPVSYWAGHEVCSADPWLNGLLLLSSSGVLGTGSFHPKSAGQQAYAREV